MTLCLCWWACLGAESHEIGEIGGGEALRLPSAAAGSWAAQWLPRVRSAGFQPGALRGRRRRLGRRAMVLQAGTFGRLARWWQLNSLASCEKPSA